MNTKMKQYLREAIDAAIEAHRADISDVEREAAEKRMQESFHNFVLAKTKVLLGEADDCDDDDDDDIDPEVDDEDRDPDADPEVDDDEDRDPDAEDDEDK